jgi:hypothetical protein
MTDGVEDAVRRIAAAAQEEKTSGPFSMNVGTRDGKSVLLEFSRTVRWMDLSPGQARMLARGLNEQADLIDPPGTPDGVTKQ